MMASLPSAFALAKVREIPVHGISCRCAAYGPSKASSYTVKINPCPYGVASDHDKWSLVDLQSGWVLVLMAPKYLVEQPVRQKPARSAWNGRSIRLRCSLMRRQMPERP